MAKKLSDGTKELFTNFAILTYCDAAALKCEGEMKMHAPWKNHTGEARRRLRGRAYSSETIQANPEALERLARANEKPLEAKEYIIELTSNVHYAVYLEYAHEAKYAIIKPTIQKMTQEVMNGLQYLLIKINK